MPETLRIGGDFRHCILEQIVSYGTHVSRFYCCRWIGQIALQCRRRQRQLGSGSAAVRDARKISYAMPVSWKTRCGQSARDFGRRDYGLQFFKRVIATPLKFCYLSFERSDL